MNSLSFRQGAIVIAEFPFSDYSGNKYRPVLIASGDNYNKSGEDVIVAKVTSNLKDRPFSINLSQKDLEEGHLIKDSSIKVDSIIVISKGLVNKQIARVKAEIIESVKSKMKLIFSI